MNKKTFVEVLEYLETDGIIEDFEFFKKNNSIAVWSLDGEEKAVYVFDENENSNDIVNELYGDDNDVVIEGADEQENLYDEQDNEVVENIKFENFTYKIVEKMGEEDTDNLIRLFNKLCNVIEELQLEK